jgi:hypothetical protein
MALVGPVRINGLRRKAAAPDHTLEKYGNPPPLPRRSRRRIKAHDALNRPRPRHLGARPPCTHDPPVAMRGVLDRGPSPRLLGGRLDKTGTHAIDGSRGEAVGKPSVAGVYTNQRLNLSKPREGTRRTCQGLQPDPGNLAVPGF